MRSNTRQPHSRFAAALSLQISLLAVLPHLGFSSEEKQPQKVNREKVVRLGTLAVGEYPGQVLFQYPEDDGKNYRVDVTINKPNNTKPIDSQRLDVWLLARSGKAVRVKERPRAGALIETSSAGSTASAIYIFERSVNRNDLVGVVVSADSELTTFKIPHFNSSVVDDDVAPRKTGEFLKMFLPYLITKAQLLDSKQQLLGNSSKIEYCGETYWVSTVGLGFGVPYTLVGVYAPAENGDLHRCLLAESWAAGNLKATVDDNGILELREHANSALKGQVILSCNLKSVGTQVSSKSD